MLNFGCLLLAASHGEQAGGRGFNYIIFNFLLYKLYQIDCSSQGEQAGTEVFNCIRLIVVWHLWRLMSFCQEKPGVLMTLNTRTIIQIMLTVLVDVARKSSRCCDHLVL